MLRVVLAAVYVVVEQWGRTDGDVRLIMVSLPACAAFDRHVHRGGAGGAPEAC